VEGLELPYLEVEAILHRITSGQRVPVLPLLDIRADQVWEISAVWASEAGSQSTDSPNLDVAANSSNSPFLHLSN
jgi:hypothetical protein